MVVERNNLNGNF